MERARNIFMVVNFTPSDDSIGVTKKIKGTINAFRKKGHSVSYTAYGEHSVQIFDNDDNLVYERPYSTSNKKLTAITRRFDLISTARKYIKHSDEKIDIAFLRWLGFDIPYIRLLKMIKKRKMSHVIVDMHSYFTGIKFDSLKGKYMTLNTSLFHKCALKYINTMLTEGDVSSLWGVSTVHASIGISLEKFSEHSYTGNVEEINMISVANELPYHGYDRLIKSIIEYKKSYPSERKIRIHLVGVMTETTKKMIIENDLQDDVILYGKRYGDELAEIYNSCNMAVGPICQHRVGGKKGTGLKTKEYFAIGIPYFYAGEEVCVPENYPYVLEIPDDESLVDMKKIEEFYLSYCDDEKRASVMREYARNNYSWDKITDDFLEPYYSNNKTVGEKI